MNWFEGIVLYAVVWFMTCFVVLPIGLRTQGDEDEIVPGTHAGAPANFRLKRLMIRVTIWGTLVWALIAGGILFSGIGVRDIDVFHRMRPMF